MFGEAGPDRDGFAILTYHGLDEPGAVLATPPRVFARHMAILHERGVRVVSLAEVLPALRGAPASGCRVALTFDDGFRSVYESALPVLARYGFAATVFLVTDYCGRRHAWPAQARRGEGRPLLRWGDVREMSAAGIAFGSHTRTHADLTRLPDQTVEDELAASKGAIEDATGRAVDALAYPYGAYDARVKRLAQAHFTLACSTALDYVRPGSDPLALERLDVYYLRRPLLFRRLFSREVAAYVRLRRGLRALRGRRPGWLARSPGGPR